MCNIRTVLVKKPVGNVYTISTTFIVALGFNHKFILFMDR